MVVFDKATANASMQAIEEMTNNEVFNINIRWILKYKMYIGNTNKS